VSALATEQPETKIGDLKALQSACANLDEVTRSLAEVLMDKAVETMLRKRGIVAE